MTVVEYILRSIADLNGTIVEDVKALTPEQLAWKPAPGAGPIGFIFFHYMRSQDEIIAGLRKQPSVWTQGKWWEKMGTDPRTSGAGAKGAELDKLAAIPLTTTMAYAEGVAKQSQDYMATIKDEDLETALDPARPRRTVVVMLRSFVVAHGWWHIGEVKYLKGLQGMPFAY